MQEPFTLPMALNYQRNSYSLWESALNTWNDSETKWVFNLKDVSEKTVEDLRQALTKYKVALQPNKHIQTWKKLAESLYKKFGDISKLLEQSNNDFIVLRKNIQVDYKKDFPYLSGTKIFNYWSSILIRYGKIHLKNKKEISVAPDTHVIQSSVKLGVITPEESQNLSREEIAKRWKDLLSKTSIDPIDIHSPLWFWSRNNFAYQLEEAS